MEKEYNQEEFLTFLSNARFEGENIENWSMPELMSIVSEFQQKSVMREKAPSVDILMD